MSDSSPHQDSPASTVRSLQVEGISGDYVLIPQTGETQTSEDPNDSIDLGTLIAILRRRLPLALGILVTTVGLGATLTLYQRLFSPVYEGGFSLLVGDPVSSVVQSQYSESDSDLKGLALQSSRVANIQISQDLIDVLMSPLLIKPISQRMGINEDKIADNLTIETRSGNTSSVLDISLKWRNPKEGEQILHSLKNDYLDFSTNQRRERLAEAISYLNEQAPALQNKLTVIQGQLSDFRIRNRFLEPSTEGDAIVKQLESLKERQDELLRKEAELGALADAVRAGNLSGQQIPRVEQPLSTAPKAIGTIESRVEGGFDQLQIDLTQLEKELAIAEASFQPSSPIVQSLKARISRVKPLLQQRQLDAIAATLKQINGEQNEIKRQRTELQNRFSLNPVLIKQNDAIQQRLEVAKANLTAYIKAREDFRLLIAQRTIPWKVITPPIFEDKPTQPNTALNLLVSMLLGVVAGVGAAFLRDKMDNVFHTSQEVAQDMGIPLLGCLSLLPRVSGHQTVGREAFEDDKEDIMSTEALRNLYTNIRLLRTDKSRRLIAITSTLEGEGKSTLTAHFAEALSDLGKRVLVVDADLRQPIMHSFFGVANVKGFSDLLSDSTSSPEQFIRSACDTLHLLTAGATAPNPPNLLSSERCSIVVEQIRQLQGYDYVLFDISPALDLSDSLLISEKLDAILFVVSLDHVQRNLPPLALKRIQSTGTEVLGVVCNEDKSPPVPTLAKLMNIRGRVPTLFRRSAGSHMTSITPETT